VDPDGKRPITAEEIRFVQYFIGDTWGISDCQINETEGNNHYYNILGATVPSDAIHGLPSDRSTFVHEVFHYIQHQNNKRNFFFIMAIDYLMYDDPHHIKGDPYFLNINSWKDLKTYEQQATFIDTFVGSFVNYCYNVNLLATAKIPLPEFKESTDNLRSRLFHYARILYDEGFRSDAINFVLGLSRKRGGKDPYGPGYNQSSDHGNTGW
jgi:hypothetical protein